MPNRSDAASLEARQHQFEQAWQVCLHGGPVPAWADYLPSPSKACPADFVELVFRTDIEYRVNAGLGAILEQPYFEHPRWRAMPMPLAAALQVELIRWEYQQRWSRRHRIGRQAYIERFPAHAEALHSLRPRWNCPACKFTGLCLEEETAATACCPRCQACYPVVEVFRPAAELFRPAVTAPLARPALTEMQTTANSDGAAPPAVPPTDHEEPEPAIAAGGGAAVPLNGTGYVVARYRALRLHAKGGLGEVYVGQDMELGREVALKRIQARYVNQPNFPEIRRRFLREAEITGALQHPGIAPVYGLVEDDQGLPCYAMRLVQGQTLAEGIRNYHDNRAAGMSDRPEFRRLLRTFIAVCNTVAYAHARGVVHRDLKGQNILLGEFDEVIVLDWGLAKCVAQSNHHSNEAPTPVITSEGLTQTAPGQVIGTPAYMAPEQASGDPNNVGSAADIYSLGVILYEILTGRLPFSGGSVHEILRKVQQDEPVAPHELSRDVHDGLERLCLWALSKKPEERPASAAEVGRIARFWLDLPISRGDNTLHDAIRRYHGKRAAGRARRRDLALLVRVLALGSQAIAQGHAGGLTYQSFSSRNFVFSDYAGLTVSFTPWGEDSLRMLQVPYVAPEQLAGQKADSRSDIYVVGVILYEILAGQPPFGECSPNEVLRRAKSYDKTTVLAALSGKGAPPGLLAVCRRAMTAKPEHRYGTMTEFANDLIAWAGHRPVSVDQRGWVSAWRWLRTHLLDVVVLVVLIQFVIGVFAVWLVVRDMAATISLGCLAGLAAAGIIRLISRGRLGRKMHSRQSSAPPN